MKPQNAIYLNLVISIIFAIAMIASSYFFDGHENQQMVTNLLIAVWFVPFFWLSRMSAKEIENKT